MLAEIYLLKFEAAVRAAKEAATIVSTSRFVPVTLTGCQGVLTPPSIAPSPSARQQLRRTARIQNNSGLSQGPATWPVVG
jgi:hypothetical protein